MIKMLFLSTTLKNFNPLLNPFMKNHFSIALLLLLSLQLPSLAGSQFQSARFYQVTGSAQAGGLNKQILWGKMKGENTTATGGWGVSQLAFVLANSNNSNVIKAKLWYSTELEFSTAVVKDSVMVMGDTIRFNINGVNNLGNAWVYFFLTYDISSTACNGNILDALVPDNGITTTGNGAGQKSVVSGYADPTGYRSVLAQPVLPAVGLTASANSICAGSPVVFTPIPVNGGLTPVYEWFVNEVSVATTTAGYFGGAFYPGNYTTSGLTDQSRVYCRITSNLACVTTAGTSPVQVITVINIINNTVVISGPATAYEGAVATFTAVSSLTLPAYQWYKNGAAISGATQNTLSTSFTGSGNSITCKVTSNGACTLPTVAVSNLLPVSVIKKSRSAAIMDMTVINGETSQSNLFSAKHLMDVAGISYVVINKWEDIQSYPMVLCSSWLDNVSANANESAIISNYVQNGGVIITPRFKNDILKPVFGISGYASSTARYRINWNMSSNDASLRWLNDSLEQTVSLGRSSEFPTIFDARSYVLSTGSALAFYEDGNVAITKNQYQNGCAYALGISFKDLVLRPQLNLDYNAQRVFSNGFEPSTDVFILWIKGLYAKHVPNSVWKHTSPKNTKATIMMTHDIDATTACLLMPTFADYEDSLGISSTYFITTHYVRDFFAKDFWSSHTTQRQYLLAKNQNVGSHSVGHLPDMEDETIVGVGTTGNTTANYQPQYNGNTTVGATIYGEVEVSKNLLDQDLGIDVTVYRPGFLYQHNQQINAMSDLGYKYSSSMSSNDVLTAFPYLTHRDMTFNGALTDIYEIPMTISDAQISNKLDSSNYPTHVAQWLYCVDRNTANGAPTNLLIHPTRDFKLKAERSFISQLPGGLTFRNVDAFGDYWKMRDAMSFTSVMDSSNNLTIVIPNANLPLNEEFSMVVDNGQLLAGIKVVDESGNQISMTQGTWTDNGIILYSEDLTNSGSRRAFVSGSTDKENAGNQAGIYTRCYPNPFNSETNIVYLLDSKAPVSLQVFNMYGVNVKTLVNGTETEGLHQVIFDASDLPGGIYYYQLTINGKSRTEKVMLSK